MHFKADQIAVDYWAQHPCIKCGRACDFVLVQFANKPQAEQSYWGFCESCANQEDKQRDWRLKIRTGIYRLLILEYLQP